MKSISVKSYPVFGWCKNCETASITLEVYPLVVCAIMLSNACPLHRNQVFSLALIVKPLCDHPSSRRLGCDRLLFATYALFIQLFVYSHHVASASHAYLRISIVRQELTHRKSYRRRSRRCQKTQLNQISSKTKASN